MKFPATLSFLLRATLPAFLLATAGWAHTDRVFTTTPTQALEANSLVRLLEEWHYNREAVKVQNYAEVVPDFMTELDGQHLFFLAADKESFEKRYPTRWLYNNVAGLGRLEPAYSIFSTYENRVESRVSWILNALKSDFDLNAPESFDVEREKAPWPADAAAADALWMKRLKFEIILELLNKNTVDGAKQVVRKRYERLLKNVDDFESSEVAEIFLSTIARLYDPHSTYFSAESYEDFGIQLSLQLVGIGAVLAVEDDYCVIKEIMPGGPADRSHLLRKDDKIIAVGTPDGETLEIFGMKLRRIVDQIRGPKGSKVRLIVQPAGAADPSVRREIVLTRDLINLDSARAHAAVFDVPDSNGGTVPIGVISLPAFYGPSGTAEGEQNSASKDVAELIERLKRAGIQGLVLDLRDNGGGLVTEAVDLTGLFIKQGPVVQVKNYYGEVRVDSDENAGIAYAGPLAVLVSKFSASASEIVVGALQNYGRAVVVGDSSTHGKGSVQAPIELKELNPKLARSAEKSGAAKLTVQKFYLPNGDSTQLKGVVPDIVLPSIDDYLPVGEKSLPHALGWDVIPSSAFSGKPLDARVIEPLRVGSQRRQAELPEFGYLKKSIEWFKERQEQRIFSLNLAQREKQRTADTEFRKSLQKERASLEKNLFAFREIRLGNAPAPAAPAPAASPENGATDDDDDPAPPQGYSSLDVHLREALRIVGDALQMGRSRSEWATDHAPLTAVASGG
ncbi:tail-specific protease [Opitutaceae bacterium EW11]|nr:tail-specific protease [Opitutaceae bacterium EW11]